MPVAHRAISRTNVHNMYIGSLVINFGIIWIKTPKIYMKDNLKSRLRNGGLLVQVLTANGNSTCNRDVTWVATQWVLNSQVLYFASGLDLKLPVPWPLQWRHNGRDSVSNHQPHGCLLNQTQIKENIKAPRHWPLCGEFTGDRWIPRTNGQ